MYIYTPLVEFTILSFFFFCLIEVIVFVWVIKW